MMNRVLLVLGMISLATGVPSWSRSLHSSPADTTKPVKRFSLFPLPLIYYTPETRFAFGAALTTTFRFRRDTARTVRPSQITVGAAYTQNRQFLFYLPFSVFYNQNRYFANGEAGYFKYNFFYFDQRPNELRTDGKPLQEVYGVNFPRIRLNLYRRVWDRGEGKGLYAGVRYEFEDYRITEREPGGRLASGTIPGSAGNRISGIGPGLFYDTRNNILYPTRGLLADFSYRVHDERLGATSHFERYVADIASYHALTSKTTLALNYVLSLTTGQAPFSALSFLGGNKRARGFYEGRYRDDNLALLQGEVRQQLWGRLGIAVFGSLGALGTTTRGRDNRNQLLRLDQPRGAYGAGLRFRINNEKLNIRADYGRGLPQTGMGSSGFYLTIGEAF